MSDLEHATGALQDGQTGVGASELNALATGLRLKKEAITNKTNWADPTSSGVLLVYDPVDDSLKRGTLGAAVFNSAALVDSRTAENEPALDVYLLVWDPNASGFVKVSRSNLIHDFPEIHDPDMYQEVTAPANDGWVIWYNTDTEDWGKVKRSNLFNNLADAVPTNALVNGAVTLEKMAAMADMRLLGNVSGDSATPAEVVILDEHDLASDSATSLPTQQSVKAYVDAAIRYSGYIHLQDRKTSGTNGQSATNAWDVRELTTEVSDVGDNCSLSSNAFTLTAGTYRISARVQGTRDAHRIRLYNVTDSAVQANVGGDDLYGSVASLGATDFFGTSDAVADSLLIGRFTIATAKVLRIEQKWSRTGGYGGIGSGLGGAEIYADVELWKEL